jgi:hypothetical protein
MTWHLEDVEARQRESPRHYPIPPSAERQSLQPGDLVKLVFLSDADDGDGERMWVEVDTVEGGDFIGTLANQPKVVPLSPGAEIRFQPRHVAAVLFEPIDASTLVIVSRRVLDDDAWPERLVRQPPSGEYSGWQVFAGDEPAGWAQDPANARAVPVAQILDLFPVLESVFGDSTPGEWRWHSQGLEYRR